MKHRLPKVWPLVLGLCVAACGSGTDGADGPAERGNVAPAAAGAAPAAAAAVAAQPAAEAPTRQTPLSIEDMGYDRGPADAPVLVLEFSDFGCPYCGRFALETLPQIQQEFIDLGVVRWKYVPFVIGMFPNGGEAARAAECAADQGESNFWAMHDRLYRAQQEWKSTMNPTELFEGYARDLDLELEAFSDCYESDEVYRRVNTSTALAARLGVRSTPTFFVDGVRVRGALPMEHFRLLLRGAAAEEGAGGQ